MRYLTILAIITLASSNANSMCLVRDKEKLTLTDFQIPREKRIYMRTAKSPDCQNEMCIFSPGELLFYSLNSTTNRPEIVWKRVDHKEITLSMTEVSSIQNANGATVPTSKFLKSDPVSGSDGKKYVFYLLQRGDLYRCSSVGFLDGDRDLTEFCKVYEIEVFREGDNSHMEPDDSKSEWPSTCSVPAQPGSSGGSEPPPPPK